MATITINIEDEEKQQMLKGVLKALKIPFKVKAQDAKAEKSPYDPEFVAKIKKSQEQIKNGECKTFKNIEEFRRHYKLDEL